MKLFTKIVLLVFTVLFTLAFITMLAACISMKIDYSGKTMTRSASDFFSALIAIAVITGIPTVALWIIMLRQHKV